MTVEPEDEDEPPAEGLDSDPHAVSPITLRASASEFTRSIDFSLGRQLTQTKNNTIRVLWQRHRWCCQRLDSDTLGDVASFGDSVRRRRRSLGLTLEALAERADLSTNYLGSVELGRRDPSLSTVRAIAEGLQTTPAELFGRIAKLSPEATELARIFDRLDAQDQDALLRLCRSLPRRR